MQFKFVLPIDVSAKSASQDNKQSNILYAKVRPLSVFNWLLFPHNLPTGQRSGSPAACSSPGETRQRQHGRQGCGELDQKPGGKSFCSTFANSHLKHQAVSIDHRLPPPTLVRKRSCSLKTRFLLHHSHFGTFPTF
jgi:hypothetical protein